MNEINWTQVIVTGVVLGVVAAACVWWLERFESGKLHAQVSEYLGKRAEFDEWLREHGRGPITES